MDNKIEIKKAKSEDVNNLMSLWIPFMKEHDDIMKVNPKVRDMIKFKPDAKEIYRKYLLKILKSKNTAIFLAMQAGKPVGFFSVTIQKNFPIFKIEKTGMITDAYVKKEFRGKKIATLMKDEAQLWLKQRNIDYISSGLFIDNRVSYKMHKRWGFTDFHLTMRKKI